MPDDLFYALYLEWSGLADIKRRIRAGEPVSEDARKFLIEIAALAAECLDACAEKQGIAA